MAEMMDELEVQFNTWNLAFERKGRKGRLKSWNVALEKGDS